MGENPFTDTPLYPADHPRWPHINGERCRQQLVDAQGKLFTTVEDEETSLEIARIGPNGVQRSTAENVPRLGQELDGIARRHHPTHIFYIVQSYTWGPLLLTLDAFLMLFSFLKVNPSFLDVVYLFSEKVRPVEESYTAYHDHLNPPPVEDSGQVELVNDLGFVIELSYSIKHVELHGRTFPKDPFSVREIGVQHKLGGGKSDWIFIQAPDSLKDRVENFLAGNGGVAAHYQLRTHALILLVATESWRSYVTYLEELFSKQIDKGIFSKLETADVDSEILDGFTGIRQLQILTDKLHRLMHILSLNIEVASRIRCLAEKLRDDANLAITDEVTSDIDMFLFQHNTHKNRLASMVHRSSGISTLIQNMLQFKSAASARRTTESNNQINQAMKTLTEQTRDLTAQGVRENTLMKRLTYHTTNDTRSMMVIALMTSIFLPATFVATLFGSNFFGFQTVNGSPRLKAASNVWIYVVVTIGLVVLTASGWWVLWKRSRVPVEPEDVDEEKGMAAS